tara:strand:+ start:10934 stop:12364 length:1431 start_codon:yes stop_codon:yes gene_type:complete
MAEATFKDVVDELTQLNLAAVSSSNMAEDQATQDEKTKDAVAKQQVSLQSRIDFSNTLLGKTARGIGTLVGFFKQSDMQQAEERREMMALLKGGLTVEAPKKSGGGAAGSGGGEDDIKIKDAALGLLGLSSGFTSIMLFWGKMKGIVTKVKGLPAKLGRFSKFFGKIFAVLAPVLAAFDGITSFLDAKKEGADTMDAFKTGFIDFMQTLFGWVLELPFKLGSWIAEKLGADALADALGEVSFKETIGNIIALGQEGFEMLFTKLFSAWESASDFVNDVVADLKAVFMKIFDGIKNALQALNPFSETEAEKAEDERKRIEKLQEELAEHKAKIADDPLFGGLFGNKNSRAEEIKRLEKELAPEESAAPSLDDTVPGMSALLATSAAEGGAGVSNAKPTEPELSQTPEAKWERIDAKRAAKMAAQTKQVAIQEEEARQSNGAPVIVGGSNSTTNQNSNTTVMNSSFIPTEDWADAATW